MSQGNALVTKLVLQSPKLQSPKPRSLFWKHFHNLELYVTQVLQQISTCANQGLKVCKITEQIHSHYSKVRLMKFENLVVVLSLKTMSLSVRKVDSLSRTCSGCSVSHSIS